MRITIFALGSRGDVQPYIPLGLRLQQGGHEVTVVAGDEYEPFVSQYGLKFFPFGSNLHQFGETEAVRDILEGRVGPIRGLRNAIGKAKLILDKVQQSSWLAGRDAECIIFSTMGLTAYHVAEKTGVPCIWALTMPVFSRTRALPNPMIPPLPFESGAFNWLAHRFFELAWQQISGGFNDFRRNTLGLPTIPLTRWPYEQIDGRPIPKLYHFSPNVVSRPPDWKAHNHVTGYWFLDEEPGWEPPADLVDFLESGPPPIYVGFGTMAEIRLGSKGNRWIESTAEIVLQALRESGQRGILASGWSELWDTELPDYVFRIEAAPHSWLFPRMAAVVHHGGAGTTGAGLRAGVPSILTPLAGDQLFWGRRVYEMGVGPRPIPHQKLTVEKLAAAITQAVSDRSMRDRAAVLGEKIRAEDGVGRAVEIIEGYLAL